MSCRERNLKMYVYLKVWSRSIAREQQLARGKLWQGHALSLCNLLVAEMSARFVKQEKLKDLQWSMRYDVCANSGARAIGWLSRKFLLAPCTPGSSKNRRLGWPTAYGISSSREFGTKLASLKRRRSLWDCGATAESFASVPWSTPSG